MKWGIVFSSASFPDPDAAIALAQMVEEVGFESLWAPNHVIMSRAPGATPYRGMPDGRMDRLSRRGDIGRAVVYLASANPAHSPVRR